MIRAARYLPTVACLCLGLAGHGVRADQPAGPAPRSGERAAPAGPGVPRTAISFAEALSAGAFRLLPSSGEPVSLTGPLGRRDFGLQPFADHNDPLQQLRSLRYTRVLRFWDDRHVSVFLGVNRAGLPGLHFERRDKNDPGPAAGFAISSDLWLLRALLPRSE